MHGDLEEGNVIRESVTKCTYTALHFEYTERCHNLYELSLFYGMIYWQTRTRFCMSSDCFLGDRNMASGFYAHLASMDKALADYCNELKVDVQAVKKVAGFLGDNVDDPTEKRFSEFVVSYLVDEYVETFRRFFKSTSINT